MIYGHDCEHTSLQHGADGCNVPGCPCAFVSWNEDDYDEQIVMCAHRRAPWLPPCGCEAAR